MGIGSSRGRRSGGLPPQRRRLSSRRTLRGRAACLNKESHPVIDGRLRRFVTGALAAASFAASAFSATGPVRETARASLVEVPVNVTGSDGRPVTGLTAADFQIEC